MDTTAIANTSFSHCQPLTIWAWTRISSCFIRCFAITGFIKTREKFMCINEACEQTMSLWSI